MLACISALAIVKIDNKGTKNKLRYCLTANIGFANINATQGKNAKSIVVLNVGPNTQEIVKQSLPISQTNK